MDLFKMLSVKWLVDMESWSLFYLFSMKWLIEM